MGLGQWALLMGKVKIRSTPQVRARSLHQGAVHRLLKPFKHAPAQLDRQQFGDGHKQDIRI